MQFDEPGDENCPSGHSVHVFDNVVFANVSINTLLVNELIINVVIITWRTSGANREVGRVGELTDTTRNASINIIRTF